jgi:hypothetical protein
MTMDAGGSEVKPILPKGVVAVPSVHIGLGVIYKPPENAVLVPIGIAF